jgi:TPR repeat protein
MPFPAKANAALPPPLAAPAVVRQPRAKKLALVAAAAVTCIALGIAVAARPHRAINPPAATLAAELPPSLLAAPASDAATADEAAALMARADQLLAVGDIVAARSFYERAAEQGDAAAMTAAGKTYDPLFLEQARVRGSRGDAGKAADWYRRAGVAGDAEAEQRLKRLIARYAG